MHLMANGLPCGRKDGHKGDHRSLETIERDRQRHKEWMRFYRTTAAGLVADVVHNASERGTK